jgi:hypothetical protein
MKVEVVERSFVTTEETFWGQILHQCLEQIGDKKWTRNVRADEEIEDVVIHLGSDSSCDENDIPSECQAV